MEVTLSGGSILPMTSAEEGYWEASVDASLAGEDYRFVIDASSAWPDPASRFQPAGVHGPSRVMDLAFSWSDRNWTGPRIEEYITCELHTGTFTPEGTLAAIEEKIRAFTGAGRERRGDHAAGAVSRPAELGI